ncbi:DNA-3-methyladenine glycosylase [Thermoflexibacter ruber]|uniref:Putative 3-methyladenine DNA glycosylase n=1 Tax=Thermoflexibacter ruber TaxID=1003 RepID=A0A1I2ACI3_9BACT|nr:DNA-3-methyladenine glycosylase [Thermoflexibacter ruber]SFE40693.1 DNA-3-methyladenine glycosylase [Thermoflexibacter ruber]
MKKLLPSFYLNPDVVEVAKQLLGKYLCTDFGEGLTIGKIVETEAYCGATDKACHAHFKRTRRNSIMFARGGVAYVYLCYGVHHLFNVVTNQEGLADAVLIRGIEPIEGIELMLKRRGFSHLAHSLTAGPGAMSKALGITTDYYGTDLCGNKIWIADEGIAIPENQIIASPRVGVAYAEEDALLPWRFRIKGNPWSSKAK